MRLASLAIAVLLLCCGCSGKADRPPPFQTPAGGAGGEGSQSGGTNDSCVPIEVVDDKDACDSATVNLLARRPTIYFVLDTSGSMTDPVSSGSESKLAAARSALRSVVSEIGDRINYGLATFPGPPMDDSEREAKDIALGCEPGEEVFAIRAGDERTCRNLPAKGPVYSKFTSAVAGLVAGGKTPLAPTLDLVAPSLLRREGQTTIVLLTDGAPNCGVDAQCSLQDCPLTGLYLECVETNCCSDDEAPEEVVNPSSYCIDGPDSVEQVTRLRSAGIDTYVIGLLGDYDLDDVMNDLATAGGHARKGTRKYYDVASLDELTSVVLDIGLTVAHSCDIELADRPPDANTLNVYFDGQVVPFDSANGWTITSEVVTLHGSACDDMNSGNVTTVQLISGCETIIR